MDAYKPRVLLLDSDPEFRILLRAFFEDHDLSVDCASDVAEAAVLIAARQYELILFGTGPDDRDTQELVALVEGLQLRAAVVRFAHGESSIDRGVHLRLDRFSAIRHLGVLVSSARDLLRSPAALGRARLA